MATGSATLAAWVDERSRQLTTDHRLGQIINLEDEFARAEEAAAREDLSMARATFEGLVERVDQLADAPRPCRVLAARATARIAVIVRDRSAARNADDRFTTLDEWPGLGGPALGDWADARALFDPEGGEMLYQRAVSSGSAPPHAVHHVARASLEKDDAGDALCVIEPLATDPATTPAVSVETHLLYAEALRRTGQHADAAWSYRHAGRLLASIGDRTAALAHLQLARELEPDDPVTATVLAELLVDDGQTEPALKLLKKVVSRRDVADDDRGRAAQALASFLVSADQTDVADRFVEDVREELGSVWRAALRGLIAAATGKIAEAIAAYGECLKLSSEPTDVAITVDTEEWAVTLARLHLRSQDPSAALDVLTEFGESTARSADYFRVLAMAREGCDDSTGALLAFDRATDFDPDDHTIYAQRAAAEHRAGQLDAAEVHYFRALQLADDADAPRIAAVLGPVLVECGRIDDAVGLANEMAARRDVDGKTAALEIVNVVLARYPDPTLRVSRARFLLELDEQLDIAVKDLRADLDPTGSPPAVVADAVEAMLRTGQAADARNLLRAVTGPNVPIGRLVAVAHHLQGWGLFDELDLVLTAAGAETRPGEAIERAELLVLQAARDDQQGLIDAANEKLARATILAPDSADLWKHYGTWLQDQRNSRDAVDKLRVARRLDPSDAEVLAALAQAYLDNGDDRLAAEVVDDAVRKRPGSALSLHLRAKVLLVTDKPLDALGDLEAMAPSTRGRAWHADHATALQLLDRDEEAVDAYRSALARDDDEPPDDVELRVRLAKVLNRLESYDETVEVLSDLSPVVDDAELDGTLAVAYEGQRLLPQAEDAYRRALTKAPDMLWLRIALATMLCDAERNGEAVELLEEWARDPSSAQASDDQLLDVATTWWLAGEGDRAAELLDRIAPSRPAGQPPPRLNYLRGAILADSGRYVEGEEFLSREASISPDDVETRRLLTELRLAIGRDQAALDALVGIEGVLALDAKRIEVLYQLGHDDVAREETAKVLTRYDQQPRLEVIAACLNGVVRAGHLEAGVELLDQALDGSSLRAPDLSLLVEPTSDLLIAAGGFEQALGLLDELEAQGNGTDLDSSIAWVCSTLGGEYAQRGVEAARRALRQSAEDPWLRKALAEALEVAGDHDEAASEFERVLQLLPDGPTSATVDMMSLRGWCEYRLGRFDHSVNSLTRAFRGRDGRPQSEHFDLALALLCAGHGARARSAYEGASNEAGSKHDALRARGLREVARLDLDEASRAGSVPNESSHLVDGIRGMLVDAIAGSTDVFDRLTVRVDNLQERRG